METGDSPSRISGFVALGRRGELLRGFIFILLIIRDNTYTLNMRSGKAGTPARLLSVVPSVPGVKFRNEVLSSVKNSNDAWIYGGPEAATLLIQGTIPANRSLFAVKGAMHRPEDCFLVEVEKRLKKAGVMVDKQEVEKGNNGRQLLLTMISPLLKDIVFTRTRIA